MSERDEKSPEERELEEQLVRAAALVREVEEIPDDGLREKARAIVQAVLDLHGAALARVLELACPDGEAGSALLEKLATDDVVSSLLLLHDLHPFDLEERVRRALDRIRTALVLRGARADLVALDPSGTVKVRVVRETSGCGSDVGRLQGLVEDALARAAPEAAVEVEVTLDPVSAFVPLESLREPRRAA